MSYLEIKSTLVILWSIFIPLKNKQRNEQYLPISTDKLCNTFAKLLTPNPSDYHSEIRKIPISET
jgi:hypothetical protein